MIGLPGAVAVSGKEAGRADFSTRTSGGATGVLVIVQLMTSPGLASTPIAAPVAVVVLPPTPVHAQPLGRNAPSPDSSPSVRVYEPAASSPKDSNVPAVVKSIVPSSLTSTESDASPLSATGHTPTPPSASLSTLMTAGAGEFVIVQVTVSNVTGSPGTVSTKSPSIVTPSGGVTTAGNSCVPGTSVVSTFSTISEPHTLKSSAPGSPSSLRVALALLPVREITRPNPNAWQLSGVARLNTLGARFRAVRSSATSAKYCTGDSSTLALVTPTSTAEPSASGVPPHVAVFRPCASP